MYEYSKSMLQDQLVERGYHFRHALNNQAHRLKRKLKKMPFRRGQPKDDAYWNYIG